LATKHKKIEVSSVLQRLYWLDNSFIYSSSTQWWIIHYTTVLWMRTYPYCTHSAFREPSFL